MKKGLLFFMGVALFGLTGCSARYFNTWFRSEQEEADQMCQNIIDAYTQQDSEKLKNLFSEESRENIPELDAEIVSFLDYIKGNVKSFEGDCASSSESEHGKKKTELTGMYLISTDEEQYCMNFYMYSKDDENPQNIGLYKLEIATEEEVNKEDFVWDHAEMGIFVEEEKIEKTYKELAEIFSKYDIQGINPQVIEELEQNYEELPPGIIFDKAAAFLTALGHGDYDYENMTWTPYENGVYTFDVEIFNVDNMYTDFLTGIVSLDKEELNFTNIQEDTSQVNWEKGTGKRTVTFEWKNKPFTLEAEVVDDWFDLNVANELNKIIQKYGNGKQLFFAGDGYQECIVFYRDKAWADAFQRETGLELAEFN